MSEGMEFDLETMAKKMFATMQDQRDQEKAYSFEQNEKAAWDAFALEWMRVNADRYADLVSHVSPEKEMDMAEAVVGEIAAYASALLTLRRRAFGEGVDMVAVAEHLRKKAEKEKAAK